MGKGLDIGHGLGPSVGLLNLSLTQSPQLYNIDNSTHNVKDLCLKINESTHVKHVHQYLHILKAK